MPIRPICFMVMPFGRKPTQAEVGKGPAEIDFNALWDKAFFPLLTGLGYQAVRAENAADALSTLQRDANIKLIFSDIVMPGAMNGIALAQVISKRYAGLSVVLTSGYADMVQTAEPQFVVLRKPFQLSALEKAFREALEGQEREHGGGRVLSFSKPHGVAG